MTGSHVAVIDDQEQTEGDGPTTLVPWWSFTKTLIAACALRLAEQDRLALDEPLSGLPCTPRQLLQHRAGVGDYGDSSEYHAAVASGDTPWSDQELFARVPPANVLFPPGAGWAYSNVGYLLLRRLIERTYGAGLKDWSSGRSRDGIGRATSTRSDQTSRMTAPVSAACAAARRAIGTR
jgi:CubicO group peptidase (beta-lactamase class C family)